MIEGVLEMNEQQLKRHQREIRLEVLEAERLLDEAKTNHVLHLLLSILTFGIWIIVWIVLAYLNSVKRSRLKTLISQGNRTLAEIEDGVF
jgi:hypothetical protein